MIQENVDFVLQSESWSFHMGICWLNRSFLKWSQFLQHV